MSKTLNHITQDLVRINDDLALSEGEINEKLELELKSLEAELTTKTDHYGYRIEKLEAMALYWRNKAQEAGDVARSIENHIQNMRERIKATMIQLDKKDVTGEVFKFNVRVTTTPRLIVDEKEVPGHYLIQEIKTYPDKKRIKENLIKGEVVPGCHLERSLTLTIKPNKE